MKSYSIVYSVANLDKKDYIECFLKSYQSINKKVPLIISDTGSISSKEIIDNNNIKYDDYIFEKNEDLFSRSRNINLGMSIVKTEYALVSDLDVLYPLDLDDCLKLIPESHDLFKFKFIKYKENADLIRSIDNDIKFDTKLIDLCEPRFYDNVGTAFYIKTNLFKKLGGFDENFYGWGCEDKDFYYSYLYYKYGNSWIKNNTAFTNHSKGQKIHITLIHYNLNHNYELSELRNNQFISNNHYLEKKWIKILYNKI